MLFKCDKCNCVLFEEIVLKSIEDKEAPISFGDRFRAYSNSVPILKCFDCGKYHIRDVAMFGKGYSHPDVLQHKEVVRLVGKKNA
jgi:hypothetical protein